jgi:hypothetical protein
MVDCIDRYLKDLVPAKPSMELVGKTFGELVETVGQTRDEVRSSMQKLGDEIRKVADYYGEYDHSVVNGMYRRTVFMEAGSIVETKIHTEPNFTFVMKGKARVISEDGDVILTAPDMFITLPGTKRILTIEEDMVFVTMHPNPTNSTDFDALEDRLSVWTYEDLEKRTPFLEVKS